MLDKGSVSLWCNFIGMASPSLNPEAAQLHQPWTGSVPCPRKSEFIQNSHAPPCKEWVPGAYREDDSLPFQVDKEGTGSGHRHTYDTAPSLPPTVLTSHKKSYDLHTTEPKGGRRIHACLGDTPNLPVPVQAAVLSVLSPTET